MLKKLYITLGFVFLTLALPAQSHYRYEYYNYYHHQGNHNWVAPMIIGGIITYALTRPVTPPPVVYQNNPVIVLQPGQQLVCNRPYRVFNSIVGIYEVRQDCWAQ